MDYPGNLYAVAAPSGTGKSSLVKALLELDSHLSLSISHTTRKPRGQDQQGREYHFVDAQTFDQMMRAPDVGRQGRFRRLPGAADVGGAGAVIDHPRLDSHQRAADRLLVEHIDGVPFDTARERRLPRRDRRRFRRRPAPRDQPGGRRPRQQFEQMTTGEASGAGNEDWSQGASEARSPSRR